MRTTFFPILLGAFLLLTGCSSNGVNVGVGAGVNIQLYTETTDE